jgi:hypothetical protein
MDKKDIIVLLGTLACIFTLIMLMLFCLSNLIPGGKN